MNTEADARTRTGDPFITREPEEGNEGPSEGGEGRKRRARCPHCGGLLEPEKDPRERCDVRGAYAAKAADDPLGDAQDGAA
jgi:hypothetical protein